MSVTFDSNRRPDEEGIKTFFGSDAPPFASIPTADLMKKGLRQQGAEEQMLICHSNRRPDEEGIKTHLRARIGRLDVIPTADLMKKGLRRSPAS